MGRIAWNNLGEIESDTSGKTYVISQHPITGELGCCEKDGKPCWPWLRSGASPRRECKHTKEARARDMVPRLTHSLDVILELVANKAAKGLTWCEEFYDLKVEAEKAWPQGEAVFVVDHWTSFYRAKEKASAKSKRTQTAQASAAR